MIINDDGWPADDDDDEGIERLWKEINHPRHRLSDIYIQFAGNLVAEGYEFSEVALGLSWSALYLYFCRTSAGSELWAQIYIPNVVPDMMVNFTLDKYKTGSQIEDLEYALAWASLDIQAQAIK